MNKIFGIGLSKTGTTSLSNALNELEISIIHCPKTKAELFNPQSPGACDIPVVRYYKALDARFPNSKFIYTVREKESWLISMEQHFRKPSGKLFPWQAETRMAVYSQLEFDRNIYSAMYDKHDTDVREYFKERKQDLLILNICDGEGWTELLSFLNRNETKQNSFPHSKQGNKL